MMANSRKNRLLESRKRIEMRGTKKAGDKATKPSQSRVLIALVLLIVIIGVSYMRNSPALLGASSSGSGPNGQGGDAQSLIQSLIQQSTNGLSSIYSDVLNAASSSGSSSISNASTPELHAGETGGTATTTKPVTDTKNMRGSAPATIAKAKATPSSSSSSPAELSAKLAGLETMMAELLARIDASLGWFASNYDANAKAHGVMSKQLKAKAAYYNR
jgi:hypothetical protein